MNEKTCYCILKCMEMTGACIGGVEASLKAMRKCVKKHNGLVIFTVLGLTVTTLAIGGLSDRIDTLTKELEELKSAEGE